MEAKRLIESMMMVPDEDGISCPICCAWIPDADHDFVHEDGCELWELRRLFATDPVLQFAQTMQHKLDNSGKEGWEEKNPYWHLGRAHEEFFELKTAMNEKDHIGVMEEAADVANFAMFIHELERRKR